MKVATIPPGARLYDTIAELNATDLRALKEAGADGVVCYLGGNLTQELIANAHALGMGVSPVNYSRVEGWAPSATLGEGDATTSAMRLTKLEIPMDGLVDWCDLEGVAADPTEYLHAWAKVVADQGRIAGLYVGAECRLTSAQLAALPGFTRYWRACSIVPEPTCGWAMIQIYPPNLQRGGVQVDISIACEDWRGRAPTWLVGG